jgi:hypothetical protein
MNVKSMLAGVLVGLVAGSCGTAFAEPYPFQTRTLDIRKTEWLRVDFEGGLPEEAELGPKAEIQPELGRDGSRALVSSGQGIIATFPIPQTRVGQCRFDVMLDLAEALGAALADVLAVDDALGSFQLHLKGRFTFE